MAEQFEKKDNISEEEIIDTTSTNEDNNETVEDVAVESEQTAQADDSDNTSDTSEGDEEVKKKGFFNKDKKEKKDKKDQKIDELTDQYRRTLAEFDNYRKRTDKEKSAMYEIGAKDVIEKILPIVDNFERGLNSIPEDAKGSAFADGMEKIYKQFVRTLDDMGVKPIEAVGKPFDPNFHNAVMHVEDEEAGENIVVEEFQKGYTYKDFVVRHSMVKVAN